MRYVRLWWVAAACFLGACDDGEPSIGPLYAPCATSDDCSTGTPECVSFDLGVAAAPKWCTSTCTYDGDCYFAVGQGSAGGCVGVSTAHQLDPAAPVRYCLELCEPSRPGCQPGFSCVETTYDGQPVAYCVPNAP